MIYSAENGYFSKSSSDIGSAYASYLDRHAAIQPIVIIRESAYNSNGFLENIIELLILRFSVA
jgi:hypothetical protein